MLIVGSCKGPECSAYPLSQFAVASEGMSVACTAGIAAVAVAEAELENCIVVEVPAEGPVEVLAEAFAAELFAVGCSGRMDLTAVFAVAEIVAGIQYHRMPAHLAAA